MPPFTHLHVASFFSPAHADATPEQLVTAALTQGASAAALTDRDDLRGAIRHIRACLASGLDPIVGAELRSGAHRVTVLAHGGRRGSGWAALCKLVSAAGDDRQTGVSREQLVTALIGGGDAAGTVLLGPQSDVGQAIAAADANTAAALLHQWHVQLPGALAVEVVWHAHDETAGMVQAVRALELADIVGVPAILSNAVRHAGPEASLDSTPDAEGRALPLDAFQTRSRSEAWLKPYELMARIAETIVERSRLPRSAAVRLLDDTERLANACRIDADRDLGWNATRHPSHSIPGVDGAPVLAVPVRERCQRALAERYAGRETTRHDDAKQLLDQQLQRVSDGDLSRSLLTLEAIGSVLRSLRVNARVVYSGAGSLVDHLLGLSPVDPMRWAPEANRSRSHTQCPQIRIDPERRDELLSALQQHFGHDRVGLVNDMTGSAETVVIGDGSLRTTLPVHMSGSGVLTTTLDASDVRSLGLFTVSLLADPAQGALASTLSQVARVHGAAASRAGGLGTDVAYIDSAGVIDFDALPLDDEATFETLRRGHTIGIIECDGADEQRRLRESRPEQFGELVEFFGDRTSDAIATALTAYQGAWAKSHYPAEFLAGALRHEALHNGRARLLSEAVRMRVPLLGIDVNRSPLRYGVERIAPPRSHGVLADPDDVILGIRMPLLEVSGVSEQLRERIRSGRPYGSIADLATRAEPSHDALAALGHAGALDGLLPGEASRARVMAAIRDLGARPRRPRRQATQPALALFEAERPDVTDAGADDAVAGHPSPHETRRAGDDLDQSDAPTATRPSPGSDAERVIDGYRPMLDEIGAVSADELPALQAGTTVVVAGSRTTSRTSARRDGQRTVCVSLHDGSQRFDATFDDDIRQRAGAAVFGARLLVVQGTVRDAEHGVALIEASAAWDLRALWSQWQHAHVGAE